MAEPEPNGLPAPPKHYSYDADHRLSEVRIEQSDRSQRYGYLYDALGRRIEKHQLYTTNENPTTVCGTA